MENKKEFEIGDIVELNSGSIPMTINKISDDMAEVVWINKMDVVIIANFKTKILKEHVIIPKSHN